MLQDIDLSYKAGVLYTTKSLEVGGNVSVDGTLAVAADPVSSLQVATKHYVDTSSPAAVNPNIALPSDLGFIAWSYDPAFTSSSTVVTNGTLYLSAVYIRAATTISKVWWGVATAGATPTSTQNNVGLYSSAGTLLSSVNVDAKVTGSNSVQFGTLGAAQAVATGFYWVGLLFNAGTPPTLVRTSGLVAGINDANMSTSTYRYATNGTSLTALPSPITPGSNGTGPSFWVAVS